MTRPMSETRMAVTGGLLTAFGSISLSLYTPAMPELVRAFGTDVATIKLSLTTFFAGFAFAQLVCGPLSDAFGRRRIGLIFVSIYVLGSLAAALAPNVRWLLIGRLVQGIGAAAGVSLARAMVRDLFVGEQSVRIMNLIGVILAIGPAMSPTIGGITLHLLGWQAIFLFMVAYGAMLTGLLLFTPETLADPDPSRLRPMQLLAGYGRILSTPSFLGPSLAYGCSAGGFYTLATMLPFIMIDVVGYSPLHFGFTMLAQTGSYLFGALLMRRLMPVCAAERLAVTGLAIIGLAALLFLLAPRAFAPGFFSIMGPVAVFAFGIAFISPLMQTAALAPFPHTAGSASAALGFLQMGTGFLGSAVSAWFGDPVAAFATILPAMSAVALLGGIQAISAVRRAGAASAAARGLHPAPAE